MKRIKILKDGKVTNQAEFKDDVEADAWLAKEKANLSFGKDERWLPVGRDLKGDEYVADEVLADAIGSRDVTDVKGNVVVEKLFAPEFTVVEEDIAAEVAAKEDAKLKVEEAATNLAAFDPASIVSVEQCAQVIDQMLVAMGFKLKGK